MNRSVIVLALLLLPCLTAAPASAGSSQGFGVSPVALEFTSPSLLRGSWSEGTLRLSNSYAETVTVTVDALGDIASWISTDRGTQFTMPANTSTPLAIRVHVPDDAPNGDYSGLLRIRALGSGRPEGSGASIAIELAPALRVKVDGVQVIHFVAEQAMVDDRAPDAPIVVRSEIVNTGNVRAAPSILLVVHGEEGAEVLRETLAGSAIEPGTRSTLDFVTSRGLPKGLYWADISIPSDMGKGSFEKITFESRAGASADGPKGTPTGILQAVSPDTAHPRLGRPLAIAAQFHNDGNVDILAAKLTAEVYRDGQRVGVAQSDALRVPAGETAELVAFYTPDADGSYVIKAIVTYDGIRTTLRESTFNVGETPVADALESEGKPIPAPGLALVLGALAIGALVGMRRR